jgi:small redox-active disulfide protein 2
MRIKNISVLGMGDTECRQIEENAKTALNELKLTAKINNISEIAEIAGFGVMRTPALAIDKVVKCSGRIPSVLEIEGWLKG